LREDLTNQGEDGRRISYPKRRNPLSITNPGKEILSKKTCGGQGKINCLFILAQ
jgi:hypothetical protein